MPKKAEIKEGRRQLLTSACSVCGSPARPHSHYGAICCYSCRAFFRRGLQQKYECINKNNKNMCIQTINESNRTNCKSCRIQKCLNIGMQPSLVENNNQGSNIEPNKVQISQPIDNKMDEQQSFIILKIEDEKFIGQCEEVTTSEYQPINVLNPSTCEGYAVQPQQVQDNNETGSDDEPKVFVRFNHEDEGHRMVYDFFNVSTQNHINEAQNTVNYNPTNQSITSVLEDECPPKETSKPVDFAALIDEVFEEERLLRLQESREQDKPVSIVKPYNTCENNREMSQTTTVKKDVFKKNKKSVTNRNRVVKKKKIKSSLMETSTSHLLNSTPIQSMSKSYTQNLTNNTTSSLYIKDISANLSIQQANLRSTMADLTNIGIEHLQDSSYNIILEMLKQQQTIIQQQQHLISQQRKQLEMYLLLQQQLPVLQKSSSAKI